MFRRSLDNPGGNLDCLSGDKEPGGGGVEEGGRVSASPTDTATPDRGGAAHALNKAAKAAIEVLRTRRSALGEIYI